jgi:hypothetical protein
VNDQQREPTLVDRRCVSDHLVTLKSDLFEHDLRHSEAKRRRGPAPHLVVQELRLVQDPELTGLDEIDPLIHNQRVPRDGGIGRVG